MATKVFDNAKLIRTINKYYDIKDDCLTEYAAEGGHDFIRKGNPIWRKSLKNEEFEIISCTT